MTLAALLNALKLTDRRIGEIRVVTSGAGAGRYRHHPPSHCDGLKDVVLCDRQGAIYKGRGGLNAEKAEMAEITNREGRRGTLADVLKGADVFIGVSAPGCVTPEMVRSMNPNPILFPMANPVPEIMPDLAREAGAAVVGTGRSDFANQINNVLAFPGIFRGALDVPGQRHQRRDENCRGSCDCGLRHRRQAEPGLHHTERARPLGIPRR